VEANVGRTWLARLGWLAVVLVAVGCLGVALAWSERLPEGPVDVVWDREACAHCRMHVGEHAFAAQLQVKDGRVLHFDDPGCLLEYEAKARPDVHAVYFHHLREDRWLPRERTGFVPVSPTPMGYGLGAVEVGTPGAVPPAEALARLQREGGRGEGRP
jgi:copper chaperone NosL